MPGRGQRLQPTTDAGKLAAGNAAAQQPANLPQSHGMDSSAPLQPSISPSTGCRRRGCCVAAGKPTMPSWQLAALTRAPNDTHRSSSTRRRRCLRAAVGAPSTSSATATTAAALNTAATCRAMLMERRREGPPRRANLLVSHDEREVIRFLPRRMLGRVAVLLAVAVVASLAADGADAAERPNIVLFLTGMAGRGLRFCPSVWTSHRAHLPCPLLSSHSPNRRPGLH